MNKVEKHIRALLDGNELIIVDAGAAYGLPQHLRAAAGVATVCYFEPDKAAAEDIERQIASHGSATSRVFRTALAGTDGKRTLYVTNVPTGSSLLKPGSDFARDFVDPGYFFPMREVTVDTRPLATVLSEFGIPRADAIKLDVQGAEYEILQGARKSLAGETLSCEMEIGFPGGYLDQPGFPELNALMTASGFELFDLRPASHDRPFKGDANYYRREIFRTSDQSGSLTKRLSECDAVYFRSVNQVLERKDEAIIRRHIVLMCLYGFFIEALNLTERAADAGILSTDKAQACRTSVMAWHNDIRDIVLDSRWFEKLSHFALRASRKLQRILFKREFHRWIA